MNPVQLILIVVLCLILIELGRVAWAGKKKTKRVPMKDEMFNELLESVREGGAILRGEKAPARITRIEKDKKRK